MSLILRRGDGRALARFLAGFRTFFWAFSDTAFDFLRGIMTIQGHNRANQLNKSVDRLHIRWLMSCHGSKAKQYLPKEQIRTRHKRHVKTMTMKLQCWNGSRK